MSSSKSVYRIKSILARRDFEKSVVGRFPRLSEAIGLLSTGICPLFGILWLALCLIAGKPMRRNRLPIPSNLLPDSGAVLVPIQQTGERAQSPLS
jgi:hypothetical protein